MISTKIISKCYSLGSSVFTNNCNVRLLAPSINVPFLFTPVVGLKSQEVIELPERPKKPLTPYLRFSVEHRPVILKEHPEIKAREVMRKCGEDWKNLHSTIKEKYKNEYREENEVYAKKCFDYSTSLTEEQRAYIDELSKEKRERNKKRKDRKKLKELNKPKRPLNAFMLFMRDQAKIRNIKYNQIMMEVKGEWEFLDPSKKLSYEKQAEEEKKKYLVELKDWETKMVQEGYSKFVRTKVLQEMRPLTLKRDKLKKTTFAAGNKTKEE